MKQTAIMDRIQAQMRPGVITQSGFLGNDPRRLRDIMDDDDAYVKRSGQTHANIARRMWEMRNAGAKGLGNTIHVPPHFDVRVDSVRGKLPCPYGDGGFYEKANTSVRNMQLNEEVVFTDLNIHMIEEHGFYEGRNALFHVGPERLIRVLEVPSPEPTA